MGVVVGLLLAAATDLLAGGELLGEHRVGTLLAGVAVMALVGLLAAAGPARALRPAHGGLAEE